MPPISHIVYEHSYTGGKSGGGFLSAEGAIQETGFYLRYLSNAPMTTNLSAWGLSAEHAWEIGLDWKSVSYSPRTAWNALLGGTNYGGKNLFRDEMLKNISSSLNYYHLEELQTVARLGLPRPFRDNFKWISESEFTFSVPWDDFQGQIRRFDGNRPIEVRYESADQDSKTWRKAIITYEYSDKVEFPPSRFTIDLQTRDSHVITTNIIHELEVGVDPSAREGYRLNDFLPTNVTLAHIYYMSNTVRFEVRPDGAIVKYRYSKEQQRSSHSTAYSIILIFLVLSSLIGVFLMRGRGEK